MTEDHKKWFKEKCDNEILYNVVIKFLQEKSKQHDMDMDSLFIQVDEEEGTVDLYSMDHYCEYPPSYIESSESIK